MLSLNKKYLPDECNEFFFKESQVHILIISGEDSISLGEKGGSISPLDTSYEKVKCCSLPGETFLCLHFQD